MEQEIKNISSLPEGLSSEEVARLTAEGRVNKTKKKHGKSYGRIVFDNLCTAFNIIYAVIVVILLAFGSYSNLGFMAVVIPNVLLAIIQEIRAKMMVSKLSVTTDPRATVVRDGELAEIPASDVVVGDVMKLEISRQILADAIVLSGICEVNESMLTGESVPVKKQAGDRLFAGSYLVSGSVFAKVDRVGEENYINALESAAKKHKAPTSNLFRSLDFLVKGIGMFMLPLAVGTFICNWFVNSGAGLSTYERIQTVTEATCGSVIGMIPAGMYLLVTVTLSLSVILLGRKKTLVQDMYSIEMLARADVLCLDKTGTITDGTMRVSDVILLDGELSRVEAVMAALESREDAVNATSRALIEHFGRADVHFIDEIPFSSSRKFSAGDIEGLGIFAIGAPGFVPCPVSEEMRAKIDEHAALGERVLLLAELDKLAEDAKGVAVALIALEDRIRPGAEDTIRRFQEQDVTVKVISGDHAATVSAIATKVGIKDADKYISCENLTDEELAAAAETHSVFGRVTPEQKVLLIKTMKSAGHTVAMTGDGVNDTLALKEANCAVAMADGSEVARAISQIVLLDSDFSHLPEVVREGRRCINNVRGSASLFVMKTVFTILISLFGIITWTGYPFEPKNFLFLEFFIIGIASFLLAFEPNNERIKGNFLEYVLSASVPYAIGMFIPTLALLIFQKYFNYGLSLDIRNGIAMCAVILAGYINLTNICRPYTKWRLGVALGIGGGLSVGVGLGFILDKFLFIGESADQALGFMAAIGDVKVLLIVLVMSAASAFLMHLLREPVSNIIGKIISKIEERRA